MLSGARLAGVRFKPRDIPGGDGAAYIAASVAAIPREFETQVAVSAPYEQVAAALSWVEHTPVESEADSCTVRLRANKLDQLVMAVARMALTAPVRVAEPGAVADEVAALVGRIGRPADPERDPTQSRSA